MIKMIALPQPGQVVLQMVFGTVTEFRGVSGTTAEKLAVSTLASQIKNYAKNRLHCFEMHPNDRLRRRQQAAQKIEYCMSHTYKWNLKKMAQVVNSLSNELTILLPPTDSKLYRSASQFVFDLQLWASHELQGQ